jgi:HK97 gp10 family phage protein
MNFKGGLVGFDELRGAIKELPDAMEKRVYDNATRTLARKFQAEFKAVVPRGQEPSDASRKYGPAWRNIRIRRWRNTKNGVVGYSVDRGRAYWLDFFERGTSRQPARPFFRPLLDNFTQRFQALMGSALLVGLNQQANRLAGKYGTIRRALLRS